MALSQLKSKRKITGGRYKHYRKKKLYELGRNPTLTKINKRKTTLVRKKGGKTKNILLSTNEVNVFTGKEHKKVKIKSVLENPANRHFVRRNILTKGAIIETEIGKALITSRPGQEGIINAVLIKEEKSSSA